MPASCTRLTLLAMIALLGLGSPHGWANKPPAVPLSQLTQACIKEGRTVSCAKAGVRYEKQGKKQQAARFYKAACTAFIGPIGSACYLWGRLLSDKKQAHKAFLKACTLNDPDGCTAAGEGLAKQRKHQQAIKFYRKGCKGNDGRGCHRVARHLFRKNQNASAAQYLRRSCALGYSAGCGYLGWYYEVKQKNPKKAKKAYAYGCQKWKGAVECARLGLVLFKLKKPKEALRFLRRSCRLGYRRGCQLSRKLNRRQKSFR